jgi:hypothetical protein
MIFQVAYWIVTEFSASLAAKRAHKDADEFHIAGTDSLIECYLTVKGGVFKVLLVLRKDMLSDHFFSITAQYPHSDTYSRAKISAETEFGIYVRCCLRILYHISLKIARKNGQEIPVRLKERGYRRMSKEFQ